MLRGWTAELFFLISRAQCIPDLPKCHADAGGAGVAAASVAEHAVDSRHVIARASAGESGGRAVEAIAGNFGGVGRDRGGSGEALMVAGYRRVT
jgi:hypothetical protein